MISITRSPSRPRASIWVAALFAPFAWSAAVSLMFMLVDETCVQGSKLRLWVSVATCIAVAAAPAVFVAPLRRYTDNSAGLIRDLVGAGSIVFAMVMLVTGVPVLLLDACHG